MGFFRWLQENPLLKNRKHIRTERSLAFLLLVAIVAALACLSFYPDSATYAQTETAETLEIPVLTAMSTETNTVELSWTAVTGAVRYELWVWDSVTGWQRLDDGSLTSTTYTHGGLATGTTYWFAVRAVDAGGATSDWSEYANATVSETQVPALTVTPTPTVTSTLMPAPTPTASTQIAATLTPTSTPDAATFAHAKPVLSAVAAAGAVELSWTAVTGAVRYELWAWQNSVTGWQRLDDGSLTSISYTHGGLTAGTTYWYAVRAVDAGGTASAWSEYANATVSDGSALTPTATPTATPTTTPTPAVTATPTITPSPTAATTEREALVALYNATNGPRWYDNTNWLSDKPLRQWYGVNTDSHGRVTHLSLTLNNLAGVIPPELGNLANLTHLELPENYLLRDSIPPELGKLANLRSLNLYNNRLSGSIPAELGNLANLTNLQLYSTRLSGSIPAELGNLANLTNLSLHDNRLSGSIPAELGDLDNLRYLGLYNNQLSGSIPPELGNLTSLKHLDLFSNQLSGSIPAELGKLDNLTSLRLLNNQLSGSIPTELGNLDNLDRLSLRNNQLSGSIPAELGDLDNLRYLGLSNNQLSGNIPAELGDLDYLHWLYLHNNQLTGSIPAEVGNSVYLTELRLGGNQFSGCVPAVLRDMAARNDLASLGLPFCGS